MKVQNIFQENVVTCFCTWCVEKFPSDISVHKFSLDVTEIFALMLNPAIDTIFEMTYSMCL